jgi:hypothetical protein
VQQRALMLFLILRRHGKAIQCAKDWAGLTGRGFEAQLSKSLSGVALDCFVVVRRPDDFRDTVCPMKCPVMRCGNGKTRRVIAEIQARPFRYGHDDSHQCDTGGAQGLARGSQLADLPPTKRTVETSEHHEENRPTT